MKSRLFVIGILMLLCVPVWGVSIAPQIIEQLKESGQLQSIVQADRAAREKGVWQPNPTPYRFGISADVDTLHCLIVLVDFDDMPHENGRDTQPADFDTLLFSTGVRHPGSMSDYYNETSYGKAYLTGHVTQWYRMPELYSYYVDGQRGFGNYPRNAQRLTEDAVTTADPDIDFSLYDNNQDGYVDGLFVVHAGPGYEDTGNLNYIHSHAWVTSYPMNVDDVVVYRYSMEPEETAGGQLETIGVFCHEFGHVLGLPDLYDTDYDSQGLGGWSVMADGSWGGGGAIPVHFDAWCKYQLGWAIPTILQNNLPHEQIDAVEFSPDTYQLFGQGVPSSQYFLVENRQRALFDVSVPGSGLLIYHVDETIPDNNDQNHYKVAVEQADGRFDLENNFAADAGNPWPGNTHNRTFDDSSTPNSRFYDASTSEVSVSNIPDADSSVFADLSISFTTPLYELLSLTVNDSLGGNGNGRPEPGEVCRLFFQAQNSRAQVDSLRVILSCSDSSVDVTDSVSLFGTLPTNEPFSNSSDPMEFYVPNSYGSNFVWFNLNFIALNGAYQQQLSGRILLGHPTLLLVDDDHGGNDVDTFYTQALDSLNRPYDIWDEWRQGSPASELAAYSYVVWYTGDTSSDVIPIQDVNALTSYLSGGGRLLMTSQDFAQRLTERGAPEDLALLRDYLKITYNTQEIDHRIIGQAGTVFDSLRFYTWGVGSAFNQYSEDNFILQNGGILLLNYQLGNVAGVGVISNYVAMTIGFGLEGVNDDYVYYAKRKVLLEKALEFLAQPVSIDDQSPQIPSAISLSQNYPNPFNPTTEIAFDIPRPGNFQLVIYDLLGRVVARPVDSFLQAGHHSVIWDGNAAPSGVYFYRLIGRDKTISKRMILIK
jgi:immune inhibitor A